MTDLVYDYIATGVDMIVSAVILSAIVVLLRSTSTLTSISANQQAIAEGISYYKEFNIFDNTTNLSSADIISMLSRYKTEVELVVLLNSIPVDVDGNGSSESITTVTNRGNSLLFEDDMYVVKYLDSSGVECTIKKDFNWVRQILLSDFTYSAKLCEDGSSTPSEYYSGGVVSGIKVIKN